MDGYLLDLDGVLYRGKSVVTGAARFLKQLRASGRPYLCLTNHSCRTPSEVAEKLRRMGLPISRDRILTAGMVTAAWLRQEKATGVFAIGESAFFGVLKAEGIEPDARRPSHVVVSLDRAVAPARLGRAAQLLMQGLPFVATNPDVSYPSEKTPEPECGFLLAGLERMTGRRPLVIGKPARFMFELAAERLGLPAHRLTMIGDRLDTDIAGAKRAGMRTILVLSGHTTAEMARKSRVRPGKIITRISELRLDEQDAAA